MCGFSVLVVCATARVGGIALYSYYFVALARRARSIVQLEPPSAMSGASSSSWQPKKVTTPPKAAPEKVTTPPKAAPKKMPTATAAVPVLEPPRKEEVPGEVDDAAPLKKVRGPRGGKDRASKIKWQMKHAVHALSKKGLLDAGSALMLRAALLS